MKRSTWQVLLGVLVACAALAVSTGEARAWGWGCCAPVYSCYTPCCWSSCYTPCCDGVWYLGWRPGPIRRAVFGPYRWYYGGYGCFSYGYCGSAWVGSYCGVCCCDPCCCDGTTVTTTTTVPQQPTPAPMPAVKVPTEPAEQGTSVDGAGGAATPAVPTDSTVPADATTPGIPAVPGGPTDTTPAMPTEPPSTIPGLRLDGGLLPTPGSSAVPTPQTSGLLTIWLPYEARVTINGNPTRSTGSKRQYVSYGLQPGYSYTYEIVATLERDGQTLTESRSVTLTAGQQNTVVFSFNAPAAEGLAAR